MKLLDVTVDTNGNPVYPREEARNFNRTVQVEITGTATVKVQGRIDNTLSWVDIKSYTANGADLIALFPQMRAISSGMAAGTAKVFLDCGEVGYQI